jgi:hypothetical protein
MERTVIVIARLPYGQKDNAQSLGEEKWSDATKEFGCFAFHPKVHLRMRVAGAATRMTLLIPAIR